MEKRQHRTLVERWIAMQLIGTHAEISMSAFENDGRKHSKIQREFVEAGYLNIIDGKPCVTAKAFNEVEAVEPDMVAVWHETLKHWNDRQDYVVAVRQNSLSTEQMAYILLNADKFKFYLMIDDEITYRRSITKKVGPFKAFEVANAYRELDKELGGLRHHPCVMISTDELEAVADEFATNEKIKRLVSANLAWALADQGVFEEGENEVPRKDSDKPANVIYSAPNDGLFFNSYGNLGDDPAKWGENLETSITRCVDRINELQRNLTLLRKMKTGIAALGGMETFVETMRTKIAEHLSKEGEEEAA